MLLWHTQRNQRGTCPRGRYQGASGSSQDDQDDHLVVEDVDQVGVKGVEVVQLGKLCQDEGKLLAEVTLGELDLPHVETPDPGDLVMPVDNCGGLPLGLGQHDVREVLAGGHHAYLLEVVVRHG